MPPQVYRNLVNDKKPDKPNHETIGWNIKTRCSNLTLTTQMKTLMYHTK
jgi:hypothetical protein